MRFERALHDAAQQRRQAADDTVDGMTKIKRFTNETFPQILISVYLSDAGFDCPEVVSLVFAQACDSGRQAANARELEGVGV